jgi:hypothetical protein
MKTSVDRRALYTVSVLSLFAALAVLAPVLTAQTQTVDQRVAAIKQSLVQSQAALKTYEWIETTAVSLKGEEKSRTQNRCYYGADGGVTKVPVADPSPASSGRGIKGKIAANKKEELSDYMKQAVALVKSYVPPDPAKIQAVKDAGGVSVEILEPGKRVRLNFRNYAKPGDNLGIEVDMTSNRLLGLKVASFLENAKDTVTLDVHVGTLTDGTSYQDQITLNAAAKKVTVKVDNSGYRKASN